MAQGLSAATTLFDKAGNPITVDLQDGKYVLYTADNSVRKALEDILLMLTQIKEVLEK